MIEAVFIGTLIPLLFLVAVLKDENRLLMLFFIWGLIAFVISLYLNNWIVKHFDISVSYLSVTWTPVLEELFKAMPLLYFAFIKKDSKISIVYYALASGIGFSIQENYLYLFEHIKGMSSPVIYIIIRSITTCLMHGISTALLGYGITEVRKFNRMMPALLFGLYTVSVTLHALFNLYINSSLNILGMMLPLILYLLGILLRKPEDKSEENVI